VPQKKVGANLPVKESSPGPKDNVLNLRPLLQWQPTPNRVAVQDMMVKDDP
jgi:hypothetical protein